MNSCGYGELPPQRTAEPRLQPVFSSQSCSLPISQRRRSVTLKSLVTRGLSCPWERGSVVRLHRHLKQKFLLMIFGRVQCSDSFSSLLTCRPCHHPGALQPRLPLQQQLRLEGRRAQIQFHFKVDQLKYNLLQLIRSLSLMVLFMLKQSLLFPFNSHINPA